MRFRTAEWHRYPSNPHMEPPVVRRLSTLLVFKAVHGTASYHLSEFCRSNAPRRCSFSTPLGCTRRSQGSTFEDQLWWSCVCSRRANAVEQTTSNNPVIWHSAEFQEPTEFHSSRARAPLNWTPCYGAIAR